MYISIANAHSPIALPIATFGPIPICSSTNSSSEAKPARIAALFQLGGLLTRSCLRAAASAFFCSSGVGLRPVRPRASTTPAALPRCLVRRLRLVGGICWESTLAADRVLDDVRRAAERNVGREVAQRGPWRERDELGGGHGRVAPDGLDHLRSGHPGVVLDVGGDLHEPLRAQFEADRADAGKAFGASVADGGGDRPGLLERGLPELDVEGDQRRPRGDERGA